MMANYREHTPLVPRESDAITRLPDFDQRMAAARARARWHIGDASWADVIITAFMSPTADAESLAAEQGER